MIDSPPLVSIVILNYKRRPALLKSVESARRQTYRNREIIVVDNNSGDQTSEYLAEHAPEVRVIALNENRGACGGRNAGLTAARGQIIITLDNDIFFERSTEVERAVEILRQRPNVSVLAFKLCNEGTGALRIREWCHPRSWREYGDAEFETNYFVEGACAIRREVLERVGGYYEPLFIGCEGWDFGLRILDQGFRILYVPNVKACHLMESETRTPDRPYYYYTRNYIIIAAKNYPLRAMVPFLAGKLGMMFYFSLRNGRLDAFARGIADGVKGMRVALEDRRPIDRGTCTYLKSLESWRPSIFARLARHREVTQL
jgi:GT2 family glycosyltransferase